MILKIHFSYCKKIDLNFKHLSEIIKKVIERENFKFGKIEIIITSEEVLTKLNKDFLNKNDLTDIITFTNTKKDKVSGELYISLERVISNSKKFSGDNIKQELYRVIIHGILHLVGYNDLKVQERAHMSNLEDYYLNELNLQIAKER